MNIIEYPLKDGGETNSPNLIVIHAMGEIINNNGEMFFAHKWLEHLGYSAHALIHPNGDVMICRNTDKGAYHARGFNKNSLGIEFLVEGEHDYGTFIKAITTQKWVAPDQWAAGVELVKHWMSLYNITDIQRHSDLSPGRKIDPGPKFEWDKFKQEIGG